MTLQGNAADSPHSPEVAQKLLGIDGVKSVFLMHNFITLTKENSADWQPLIAKASHLIGLAKDTDSDLFSQVAPSELEKDSSGKSLGQVEVAVQVFRGMCGWKLLLCPSELQAAVEPRYQCGCGLLVSANSK